MRRKCTLAIILALAAAAAAVAQQPRTIPWQLDVQQSIALAKQHNRPLMFYVLGSSSRRDNRIERDQKRSFADPRVVQLSLRFVPVKLSQYQHRDLLTGWGLSEHSNMVVVFVTPTGERIDEIGAAGVANADSFAQKIHLVYNFYRQKMYDQELREKLQNANTGSADLRSALKLVGDMVIEKADADIIKLLERPQLDAAVTKQCYDVLAVLSTNASVDTLLAQATGPDAKTAKTASSALTDCTPGAAEYLLTALKGDDLNARVVAYQAMVKICRLRNVKPARFWEGDNERVQAEEIKRVEEIVVNLARKWKALNVYR
ncbi:MAG: hypothetical protein KKB50_19770 [Planctomycetes bacterium]|nr:hypothetical protein [Planctomycetota bacterium]